ncbi:MAG: hypothetical protein ACLR6J_13085 [Parabacteroides merdae]
MTDGFRYPLCTAQEVIKDKIDPYLVYRRIAPGYRMWNRMGISGVAWRVLRKKPFLDNKQTNNNCMNCHSLHQHAESDRMLSATCATIPGPTYPDGW